MGRPLKLEIKEQIINRYNDGLTGLAISQLLNVSVATVYGVLKRASVKTRSTPGQLKKIPDDAIGRIIKLYNDGLSTPKIAKLYGVSAEVIRTRLNAAGRTLRDMRSRTLNKRYFDKLNTPRKCYWFGYLCADGSIPGGGHHYNRLSIHIANKDAEILEELRSTLQSTNIIAKRIEHSKFKENYKTAYLQIGSKDVCEALLSHGFLDIKCGNVEPLKRVQYINDFMRGYLDGDGFIYYTKHKNLNGPIKQSKHMGWCSQFKSILEYFGNILISNGLISKYTIIHPSIHYLKVGGNIQCTNIMNWLCYNERFGLERKRYAKHVS